MLFADCKQILINYKKDITKYKFYMVLCNLKIMRFVTILGLTIIAKCIDPARISEIAGSLATVAILALIADIYELYLKSRKQ